MKQHMRWMATALVMTVMGGLTASGNPIGVESKLWPVELNLPDETPRPDGTGSLEVWTPPGVNRIRAVLAIAANTDSIHFGEYAPLRAVAVKHRMGVVHLKHAPHAKLTEPDNPSALPKIMDAIAEKTGIIEYRHAPWITFGKSSQGAFPYQMGWKYPERTIASIGYHAETPTWPMPAWTQSADATILHVNANGEAEWGGTWSVHVRPMLLNYRVNTRWLVHQIVARGVAHGDYPGSKNGRVMGASVPGQVCASDTFDYLTVFVDKALTLRLPENQYPTDGPVKLKPVDESSGYLIEPFAIEDVFQMRRLPLRHTPNGFTSEMPTMGFIEIETATDYVPAEGTPVTPLVAGQSPSAWLITDALPFHLKTDPLLSLNGLEQLRPAPGMAVKVQNTETRFVQIPDRHVGAKGGIALNKGLGRTGDFTLLAYTVLETTEPVTLKLVAPFTPGGRLQVALNGRPVEHLQTVSFAKGRYPMLVVLSMKSYHGVKWDGFAPRFDPVSNEEIREAKSFEPIKTAQRKEAAVRQAQVIANPRVVLHRASDVAAAARKHMFWVADLEQAEAWLNYHRIVPLPTVTPP